MALVLTSPAYPWYALLLVVLVALGARPAWLGVAAAGYLAQYAAELGLSSDAARQLGYGTALLVVVVVSWRAGVRPRSPTHTPADAAVRADLPSS